MGSGRVAVFGGASTGTTGTNLYHIDNGARLVVEGRLTPVINAGIVVIWLYRYLV